MNNFPISVAQIAEGMNNASSALHAAGNSFEESVALLTAANTTLQNASKSSTGMRTIAARLRNTKAELDDLGESMTQATYDDLVSALTKYNVALTDANGDFRSTYDIMSDISKVWDDLTSQEQAGLATAIAGVRQQDVFYSLVENFNEASGAMDAMANSAGALQTAYDTYMESTTAHINQFKAAFQTVAQNTFTRDFLNGAVDFGRHLLEIFNGVQKVINAIGGLNTVLFVTASAIALIKAESIAAIFLGLGSKIASFGSMLLAIVMRLVVSFKALMTLGIAGFWKYLTVGFSSAQIAIAGIIAAIAAVTIAFKAWEKAHPTLDQLKKDLSEMESEAESLQNELDNNNARIQELQALKAAGSITAGEQAELERLQRENELIAQQIELQTQLISIKKQQIHDKAISDANEFLSTGKDKVKNSGDVVIGGEREGVGGLQNAIDKYELARQKYQDAQTKLEQAIEDNDTGAIRKYQGQIAEYGNEMTDAYSKIIDFQSELVGLRNSLDINNPSDAMVLGQIDYWLDVIMKYSDAADMLNDSASKNREAVANLLSGQDLEASTEKAVAAAKELNGLSINDLISQFPELATAASDAGIGLSDVIDMINSMAGTINVDEVKSQIRDAFDFGDVQNDFTQWIDSLSVDDLKILYEVTKSPDSGAWGFDELKQHFEEAKEAAKQGANEIADSMTKAAESTKTHLSQINAVKEALASQSTGKSISYDTFNSEELKGFSAALEYNNGALQLNAEKVRELVQAKSEEQIAFNDSQKALLQTDYLRNVAEIQSLRDALKGVDEGSAEFLDIQGQINVLLNRNEGISNQCAQYELLSQSLREATDAYHNWLNAQNASESGDMFDDAVNAMKHINETLNDSDSDFFGRIGREDYKAAVDFIVPDSIDHEDEEKVKSYMQSISDMFTYDDDGNINGLNTENFVKKALDAGLLEQDGDDYKIAGQKTMEDFAEGLGMSLPLVQAMFGELQEFGVEFSWADEASKTMGDLAVEANEAAESLRGLEGNENIDIRLDVSDIEGKEGKIQALESTIQQMQGIKAKVGVDASEVQNANSVIEYCIAQKQLLERPAIMNVDTSALSDNMALVVGKLQEFQQLSNKLELQQALGLDTSEVEGELANVQAEIQGIDPQITAQLGIDPASRETIQASIQGITPEVMVNFGINEDAIIGYSPEDKECTVNYQPDTSALPENFPALSRTVNYIADTSKLTTTLPPIYRKVILDEEANGTAHAGGTAKAGGDWGTAPGGPTLVGELGREIVVDPHSGKWYTVGDTGAEFVHIPKGSIVFNHKQTEALLEYGYVTGRASALVGGTAMVTGGSGLGRLLTKYTKKPKTATSKSPSNTAQKSPKTSTGSGSSGSNKPAKSSGGGNAAKAAGSAFEDLYKQHQHLLAMDQESVEDYLAWLDGAYQAAYKSGQIKIDDFYKYEEEVYEKTKELLTKARNEYENEAELLQKKSVLAASMSDFDSVDDYMEKIVSNYKAMQKEVAKEAAWYREHGFSDTSDEVSELSSMWLDYRDNVVGAITDAYDALDKELENRITLTENWLEMALEGGDYDKIRQYSDDITAYITARQEALHEQAERLREMGYSDSSEEVSKLSDLWWDYEQQRRTMAVETWGKVVEAAKEAADEISNVYDTLKDAANEYASMGGYLTLETLESILELGPQYLQFLKDENGLWAIDKENIEKVIAAKTEDLALTNALAYVERLRLAMNKESGEDLDNLLYATTQTANATWELVYSQLAMLGLNNDQYKAALHNINAIRSLANAAIKGIGMEANAFSDELNDMKDGLDDILGYVMDMLKQKTQDEVDALNDMKDSYGDIIDQQKKALDNSKKQADYQSDVAKKVKEIAKLQARINNLSQDTSRSAIAERAKLEEELAELQGELAETQADHIRETTENVLDEKLKAYEEEQDAEIKKLEDSISSQEKLYQKAVAYIEEQGDNLINELIAWNTEYGSVINQEISDAWEHASKALQKYGGYLEAVKATTEAIAKIGNSSGSGGNLSFGEYEDFDAPEYPSMTESSRGNQDSMYEQIGAQILSAIYSMRQNSAQYAALGGGAIATATPEQKSLVQANEDLAAGIGNLIGGKLTRGGDGYWYLPDGTNLYSILPNNAPTYQDAIAIGRRYGKFHTGGIAGGNSTLKQDEMFALLKKGEAVFTEAQQSSLMKLIDFGKAVANKIVSLSPAANILSQSVQRMSDRGLGVSAGSTSYEITVPVQIFPAQKLDESEIKSLTSRISDSTIKKLNDDFSRRGIRRGAQLI